MSAVPKLRFPEFEGRLNASPLKEKFTHIRNGFVGTATPYYVESGVPYIQGKDIKLGSITFKNNLFVSQEFHKKYSKSALKYRDLVMVQSGHVGECAMVPESLDGSNCHALIIFTPDENVSTTWVVQFFSSQYGKKKIYKIKTGNTIEHILASDMQEMELFFPSLPEQQKIASFLSAVDKKIDLLRQKKDALELYKKGLMQKIFSQEIRFKQDDGSDFPDWEEVPFERIAQRRSDRHKSEGANVFKIIELENIQSAQGSLIGDIQEKTPTSNNHIFEANDVLYGKLRPYLKKWFFADFSGACSSEIWVLRARPSVDSKFLYYLVQSEEFSLLTQISSGSKMPRADWKVIADSDFQLPVLDEQIKISNLLSGIDQKITKLAAFSDQMETFKKGLLQQMFV